MNRNKIFTAANQAAGEVRLMAEGPAEAQRLYFETDPLYIAKYWDPAADAYKYGYTGCIGERIGLTWEELINDFVALEREFEEGEEDD